MFRGIPHETPFSVFTTDLVGDGDSADFLKESEGSPQVFLAQDVASARGHGDHEILAALLGEKRQVRRLCNQEEKQSNGNHNNETSQARPVFYVILAFNVHELTLWCFAEIKRRFFGVVVSCLPSIRGKADPSESRRVRYFKCLVLSF